MRFVGVTSCPTGIAHSQMAAENLETTAADLGHEIAVEVQGAMGAENELSAEQIAEADAVIIAADTSVQRDRFEGKPLVKGTVKDAVNDPASLVAEAAELVAAEADGERAAEAEEAAEAARTAAEEAAASRGGNRGGGDRSGLLGFLERLFS